MSEDKNWEPGHTGAVKDPENDGRLKENREEGRTLGTTEHTREAPHVKGQDNKQEDDEEEAAEE